VPEDLIVVVVMVEEVVNKTVAVVVVVGVCVTENNKIIKIAQKRQKMGCLKISKAEEKTRCVRKRKRKEGKTGGHHRPLLKDSSQIATTLHNNTHLVLGLRE
jgi:hypothetical protein